MATNVLELTKIENQTILSNTESFNLSEQLRVCILMLEEKWSAKNVVFALNFREHFINADQELLAQVWINLIDNAVKYTKVGSEIIISTAERGNKIAITVADNGEGISDEIKPRVFDMFYTGVEKIADSRRSLGLGLALCKTIINAHGGEITVNDNIPHGAIFTFTLQKEEVEISE